MYIQVREPLGGIFTVDGVTYRIPCIIKVRQNQVNKFKKVLDSIKANYTLPQNGRIVKKGMPTLNKKSSIKEGKNDNTGSKKSDRKNSKD